MGSKILPFPPKKVPLLNDGIFTIEVSRDALMHDAQGAEADPIASCIRYCEILRDEIKQRYPRARISISAKPGDSPMLVDIDLHPDPGAVFANISRLATDLESQQSQKWLVRKGSRDYLRIVKHYGDPILPEEENDPGPAGGDVARDGGGDR